MVLDIVPGKYVLRAGLYLLDTGQRLSAAGPNVLPDNSVVIQEIVVTPAD
jgi:hypothetical protein